MLQPFRQRLIPAWLLTTLLATWLWAPVALGALGQPSYVAFQHTDGGLVLVGRTQHASLYVDSEDFPGVVRTTGDLQRDIERVTGKTLDLVHSAAQLGKHAVLAGTIGHSELIDRLAAEGTIDIGAIDGQWDAFHLEVVDNPLPGVERALVIAGSNRRGTSYGLYDVSEQIGVSPWHWWSDVPVRAREQLTIKANTRIQDKPVVKYRGIFLNNEWPGLTSWVRADGGDYDHEFYVKVFELLLRLKANFLWPAMWDSAFNDDDPLNPIKAHEYGIVMSTSHHEPMMRADKEWNRYGEGPWEYSTNPENLYDFWVEGAQRNKPYESIYTLGMRGQEDRPMSEGQNIELLETIVEDQREILKKVFDDRPIEEVPQVWALYKEVQYFYEAGMRVPEDVILLWANDNFGNIRRLPTPEERQRSGGAGVYYHFDYVGGPISYRWINTMPIAKMWEQMNLAYQFEANKIWIVNVGDLKPMEFPTEFFLRMAWNPERWHRERIAEYGELWAAREFGEQYAAPIAQLMAGYTRHNGRRKPEHQDHTTYSQLHYREADRIVAQMEDYTARAQALYDTLPKSSRDAFFQLVLHPIKASTTITQLYDATAKNHLYASQGRANSNHYAEKARGFFQTDADLTDYYHTELSDGKWRHMMNQTHIGYTHWNHPVANTLPVLHAYEPHDQPDMGVAVEGYARAWPVPGGPHQWSFSPYGQPERRLDIYNRGTAPFDFNITASHPWISLSKTSGTVAVNQPIQVSIDWDQAPEGDTSGDIFITGTGWGGARVNLDIFKPDGQTAEQVQGFVEADGYVSIEAQNYHRRQAVDGYNWEKIEQHGRTLSSMAPYPISDHSFTEPGSGPYLEYDIYFFSTGEFTLEGVFAPSLNAVPGRGLRYAVAFNDEPPQMVDILADETQHSWEQSVLDAARFGRSTHRIDEPGLHRLRIYMVDHALVLQKLVIDTGGLQPSYLGPPESVRQ